MGASDDIKSETGQYDASLGQKSNETSGRAIMARQREGDTATFHYVDNLARAVRHVGRIVLDMIPKVLDTKRIARIIGEDDEQQNATLDPQNPEALTEYEDEEGAMKRIFNPSVGTYDVYTSTGPSFTTRRMEAVEAMTQMTQANPQLWQVIGDLLVKNMDWPGADDMAKRLKLTLLPQVQESIAGEEGGKPQVPPQMQQAMQQMGQQVEALTQELEASVDKIEELSSEQEWKLKELTVKAYEAETKRITALGTGMTSEQVQALVMQTLQGALSTPAPAQGIQEMEQEEAMEPQEMPPDPMQEQQPTSPPSEGFFTPENGQITGQ